MSGVARGSSPLSPSPDNDPTFQTAEASFQVARPEAEVWDSTRGSYTQSVSATLASGSTTASTPFTSASQQPGDMTITVVVPAGATLAAGTYFQATTTGVGVTWTFTLAQAVTGKTIVIDTRSRTVTVGGSPAPGVLSRTSSLAVKMQPQFSGQTQSFRIVAPTAPSAAVTATATWTQIIPF